MDGIPPRTTGRPLAGIALVVIALVVTMAAIPAPAAAATPAPTTPATTATTTAAGTQPADTVTVSGRYDEIVVDNPDVTETVLESAVTVGQTMVDVPDRLAGDLTDGQTVRLSVRAPAGVDTTTEVAAALMAGDATIVGAAPAGPAPVVSSSSAGAHSLTVVPVYWTAPDAQTPATLRGIAEQTAAYWSEQTAGAITVPTVDVRPWAAITDPGTCDYWKIYNAAMAASGNPWPSGRHTPRSDFPHWNACSWAGLGSMPGSDTWINGYAHADAWEHELGHNLGIGHAKGSSGQGQGTRLPLTETCDILAYAELTGQPLQVALRPSGDGFTLNAALADYLGVLVDDQLLVEGPVAATLAPITAHAPPRAGVRTLRIPFPAQSPYRGSTLFVEYRLRWAATPGSRPTGRARRCGAGSVPIRTCWRCCAATPRCPARRRCSSA